MHRLGAWLSGIAAAGLIGAILTAIVPEKGRRFMRFATGLVMILLVLAPIRTLSGFSISDQLASIESSLHQHMEAFAIRAADGAKSIAVRETEAFLQNELEKQGISARIRLYAAQTADGEWVYESAAVQSDGMLTSTEAAAVQSLLESQTGIHPEQMHISGCD